MENKYISSEKINEIKINLESSNVLTFEVNSYIEVLLKEVEYFVKNSDYFNKIKNHIDINYSEKSINSELLFYGDITYHNYYFLHDLIYRLNDYYDKNTDLDNDNVEKGIRFIIKKIKTLEKYFDEYFKEPIFTNKSNIPEPELHDLSNNKPLEKIALLYELGIIDYLHKKDGKPHSVNSIAMVLSGITGIQPKTICSAINPLINTNSTSKGTPAKSTLTKAKAKIIELGF